MAPDTSLTSIDNPSSSPERPLQAPSCWKYRVRFRKAGDLRLVSHHDLMHVLERMFRRADLKVAITQGFHPRPRLWFALSLALGVAGLNEVLELELVNPLSADELRDRLVQRCPPGLEILSVRPIDLRTSARVRRALYELPLPETIADIEDRSAAFLARTECWAERTRPHPRRINLRPFVSELRSGEQRLQMALWITSNGAARPEEIIAALGLQHLLDAGAVIERTDLEIIDELPAGVEGPPDMRGALEETKMNDEPKPASTHPTSMIGTPLSFET
jgi:radical SAM-linked protein